MRRYDRSLMWFRRDLRLHDNAALHGALSSSRTVFCVFVFDTDILDSLPRADRRVEFILAAVQELSSEIALHGGTLRVLHGQAASEIARLAVELGVDAVFAAHDYEPRARDRDRLVARQLADKGIRLQTCKDHVIFECDEILTKESTPYGVFTPYKNAWLTALDHSHHSPYSTEPCLTRLAPGGESPAQAALGATAVTLETLGFRPTNLRELDLALGASGAKRLVDDFLQRIDRYKEGRDYPAIKGVSYLSVHLRFGTVSVRQLVRLAVERGGTGASTWLAELIWRDFYFMILHHHPRVVEHAFKSEMDALEFDQRPDRFAAWCEGRTGYPLVDAAMRQLNSTGYMHNRLRMLSASFLAKDLHLDWRLGEQYFARQLNDFDLSANNGGWQWAASTGCDAQPYFRIFNPITQSERFDPNGSFIRRYLPQLGNCNVRDIHAPWRMSSDDQRHSGVRIGLDYPAPIVDHAVERIEALARYGRLRNARG